MVLEYKYQIFKGREITMKMKRIFAAFTAVIMLFALAATAYADDAMTLVPLNQENQGSFNTDTIYNETGFTVADGAQASFKLPQEIPLDQAVLVHIAGSADGNFRVFLEYNGWDRASTIVMMNELIEGYTGGEFDVYFTLTTEDSEGKGVTAANEINFKGPTYDTNLVNLTVETCEIFIGDTEAYKAAGGNACAVVGHTIAEYVSNNDATCTEDGTKTGVCSVCGLEDTVVDEGSALGHSFGEYVSNNDATCEEDGTMTATCSVCGETDTIDDEGSALGHNYVDGVCTVCGEADPATQEAEPEIEEENTSASTSSSSNSTVTIIIVITVVIVVAIIIIVIVVAAKSKGKGKGGKN